MATVVPHRQHSFMSAATWHPRQVKQKVPQRQTPQSLKQSHRLVCQLEFWGARTNPGWVTITVGAWAIFDARSQKTKSLMQALGIAEADMSVSSRPAKATKWDSVKTIQAEEMAQWLRALAVLQEVQFPASTWWLTTIYKEISCPLLACRSTCK